RRHTRSKRDWSSDVCSSELAPAEGTLGDAPCGVVDAVGHPPYRRCSKTHGAPIPSSGQPLSRPPWAEKPEVGVAVAGGERDHHEIGRASCRGRANGRGGGGW